MDKLMLEASLGLVDDEQGLITRFYEILFDRYRPYAPCLARTLGALGAKHAGYGATAPMFDAVAECMIAAMQERGGDAWTAEMTAAWTEALGAVAGLMLAG